MPGTIAVRLVLLTSLLLLLELPCHVTHAIYHPDVPTHPPKVKERVDLKPIIPVSSARPPVVVYSRRDRTRHHAWSDTGMAWDREEGGIPSSLGHSRSRGAGGDGGIESEARNARNPYLVTDNNPGTSDHNPYNRGHNPKFNPALNSFDKPSYPDYYKPILDNPIYPMYGSSHTSRISNPGIPSTVDSLATIFNEPNTGSNPMKTSSGELFCPAQNGLFPYTQDCSKFINCANGRPYLQSCGPGTLFSDVIKSCDWPYKVICKSESGGGTPHPGSPSIPVPPPSPPRGRVEPPPPSPPRRRVEPPPPPATPPPSSIGSIVGMMSGSAGVVVDAVVDRVYGKVDRFKDKVDWTYERAKDKGKRLLKKMGVSDSVTLCLKPEGVFPYPKDCGKFVNCWRGKPSLQSCAPGTQFNAIKGICDFPSRVVCPKSKTAPSGDRVSFVVAPPSGQKMRLRGSDVPWAGYVQVEVQGNWRILTDIPSQWTRSDADVVCRALGFTRGAESNTQGRTFGILPRLVAEYSLVECQGHEEDLHQCRLVQGTQEDVERTIAGVRCMKNWASECGAGGVRWGEKCYYAHARTRISHAQAREACAQNDARLLSIHSQAENNFISELLASAGGDDEAGFHTGGVRTEIFGDSFWLWQSASSVSQPPSPALPFTNWWPGWNATTAGDGRHPAASLTVDGDDDGEDTITQCIVLRDNFPVSSSGGSTAVAPSEYFFWELTDCAEKLHYVCETDKRDVGCIEGRGEAYSGGASTTVGGEVCVSWSHPQVQEKVRHFVSLQNPLVGNRCANPDGDDLPWCYTSHRTVDFCDIPRCPQRQPEDTDVPSEIVEDESACAADKFACANGICILQEWHCDGQEDCEDGSDEQGCRDYSSHFSKRLNQKLKGKEVEKWLYTIKTTCAARCSQAKNFLCLSFNYQSESETCVLSNSNVARSGGLVAESGWDYYELENATVDCSQMFTCGDGKCLNNTQVCNGRRDCNNGEDEEDCDGRVNFEMRLVNGSSEHEGRVEVKAFGRWGAVCDDMWGLPEGDVVCQHLGFTLGARDVYFNSHFGSGETQYLMDDLNCNGDETSLAHCDFAGWGEHDCQGGETAGVTCFKPGDTCGRDQWRCQNGRCVELFYLCDKVDDCRDNSDEDRGMCQASLEVRLVNDTVSGEEASEGRVELRYLGVWGTVCDDDFGIEEGHVLCRMMGWEGASHVYKNNTFGPGSGRVWIDDLKCLGYESSVSDCQHLPWGQNNCDHSEDVGLQCSQTPPSASRGDILNDPSHATPSEGLPLPATCGQRRIDDNPNAPTLEKPKIVSGHTPPAGAHPWMVSINLLTKTGPTQWCGGALLGEDYVLTAAHCLHKYPASTYVIRIGDFNTHESEGEEQEFRAASIAIHPLFDKGPYLNNDIAILKIKRKRGEGVKFGRTVQPVCLVPPRWDYSPYLNCTVAGWGSLGATLGRSQVLQSALLPILPEEICRADHIYGPTRLTEGMFCAGYLEGGIDTCQGDSGGPMVCMVDGRHTVVGITSWGHGCARANKPGVYTKVTQFLPWLYTNLV